MQLSDKILSATNGGLDIILSLFPDAEKSLHNKGNFRVRSKADDKVASAAIKLQGEVYFVKDFATGDSWNGITLFAYVKNLEFKEALKELAGIYGIDGEKPAAKFEYSERPAKAKEKDGDVYFEYKEITDDELKIIGPYLDKSTATLANLKSAKSVTRIKDRKAKTLLSTANYPILVYDFGTWQKIYQPKSADKQWRFSYAGTKPDNHVFNLENVKGSYDALVKGNESLKNPEDENKKPTKLDYIVIASGDSDGLNFMSLGVNVVWFNSESADSTSIIFKLKKYAHKIINVPDIDKEGKRQAFKKALADIDLHTAWLPDWLLTKTDFRKAPKKDFKDYINHIKSSMFLSYSNACKHVEKWLEAATTLKFWDEKWTKTEIRYQFNFESCVHFLNANGFGRYKPNDDEVYLVKVDKNQVEKVDIQDIIQFLIDYLKRKNYPQKLRNMVFENRFLTDKRLSNALPCLELDFTMSGHDYQLIHFSNVTWKVSAKGIEELKPENNPFHVWVDDIIDKRAEVLAAQTEFKLDEIPTQNGTHKTVWLKKFDAKCLYLKYLALSSNVFWQKQKSGENLTDLETLEVKEHILNKMYALGYLMHDYKEEDKAYALWLMENEVIVDGLSHGGTGKSFFMRGIHAIKGSSKIKSMNGRNKQLTEKWPYNGVTENTRIYFIDDCHQYLDFPYFYVGITGDLEVEHKSGFKCTIPFQKSGKHVFSSNFGPRGLDGSSERRMLYVMFSDYFHANNPDKGLSEWKISDEFGKKLFTDFTDAEWNYFFNTMAESLVLYFNCNWKVNPPMGNVDKRRLLASIGDTFKEWADTYFSAENLKLNCYVVREDAFNHFVSQTKTKTYNSRRFNVSLAAWCKFYGYELNPEDIEGYSKHHNCIMRRIQTGPVVSGGVAHIYIRSDKNKSDQDLF